MLKARKKIFLASLLALILLLGAACSLENFEEKLTTPNEKKELKEVIIYFTDDQSLQGYVKDLGIEEQGRVYVGGSSLNYLYNQQGEIIAAYNYQRVLYILLVDKLKDKAVAKDD